MSQPKLQFPLYECRQCGRKSRDVDSIGLCPRCNAISFRGNELADATGINDPWEQLEVCKTAEEVNQMADRLLAEWGK